MRGAIRTSCLQAAVQADTATPAQLKRLQDVESEGQSLLQQREWLKGQLPMNPMSAKATREADLAELQKLNRDIETLVSELSPDTKSPEVTDESVEIPGLGKAFSSQAVSAMDDLSQDDPPEDQGQTGHDQHAAVPLSEAAESQLDALRQQEKLITKRLQGTYPWFIDEQFVSPRRADTTIRQATITLEACSHRGADTQNNV